LNPADCNGDHLLARVARELRFLSWHRHRAGDGGSA
jgi:hypothetical protein